MRVVRRRANFCSAIREGPAGHSGPGVLLFGDSVRASGHKTDPSAPTLGLRKATTRPYPSGHAAALAGATRTRDTAQPTLGTARARSAGYALVWAELLSETRSDGASAGGARGSGLPENSSRGL